MPNFKTNFFFAWQQSGWSETYYQTASNIQAAADNAQALLVYRGRLLAADAVCQYVRVSDDAIQNDSILRNNSVGDVGILDLGKSEPAFFSYTVNLESVDGLYRRPIYIRGLPDGVYDPSSGQALANSFWSRRLQEFLNYLIQPASIWTMKVNDKSGANPRVPIAQLVFQNTGTVQLTFAQPWAGPVYSFVHVYNAKVHPLIGTKQIADKTGNAITLVYPTPQPGFTYDGRATCKQVSYVFIKPGDWHIVGFSHRIAGRPFGQSRGRRRKTA